MKLSYIDLMCAVIKENPRGSKNDHEAEFGKLLELPENVDYRFSCYHAVVSLNYNTAKRRVFPRTKKQLADDAASRVARAQRTIWMNYRCPNGLPLRDCNGVYLRTLGGRFIALSERLGPRSTVGRTLSEGEVKRIMESRI